MKQVINLNRICIICRKYELCNYCEKYGKDIGKYLYKKQKEHEDKLKK